MRLPWLCPAPVPRARSASVVSSLLIAAPFKAMRQLSYLDYFP
jgi:hypothetical protein